MDFPIDDLLDEEACYERLLTWIHPGGLTCPGCHHDDRLHIHRRDREPVLDYRCGHCGRVFNAFTGTALQGTHYRPSTLVMILRGVAQGVSTAQLARELKCDRGHLLALRHRLQDAPFAFAITCRWTTPWWRRMSCIRTPGRKGCCTRIPSTAAAAGRPGPGPSKSDNDRPPVCGVVGRESGHIRLGGGLLPKNWST